MSELHPGPNFNMILRRSAEELMSCHDTIMHTLYETDDGVDAIKRLDSQESIIHLVETLQDATEMLYEEIAAGRVIKIDPKTLLEIEEAIDTAMNIPNVVDAKVNEIYHSIFGLNTPLWHALRSMQKLLQTSEFLKQTRGQKVAKVVKIQKVRRKRRDE